MFSHEPAHLKLYCSLGRDFNLLESLWILRGSGRSHSSLKDPEVPELQAVVLTQFPGYLVKEGLDYALDRNSLRQCSLGDPIDKFFLSDCCHKLPHFTKEQIGNCVRVRTGKSATGQISAFALSPRYIPMPHYALPEMGHSPSDTLPSKNCPARTAKPVFQITATYYTTKTSIRQVIL